MTDSQVPRRDDDRSIRAAVRAEAGDGSPRPLDGLARPSTIVSVGYEGRTANDLVAALADAGVSVLVDVREHAVSRKPGLSKRALAERCEVSGIEYRHEPTLGNPYSNRPGLRAQDPESTAAFEAHLLANGTEALGRVGELLSGRTVAVMCFEADPRTCHRSIVVQHLVERHPSASVRLL